MKCLGFRVEGLGFRVQGLGSLTNYYFICFLGRGAFWFFSSVSLGVLAVLRCLGLGLGLLLGVSPQHKAEPMAPALRFQEPMRFGLGSRV